MIHARLYFDGGVRKHKMYGSYQLEVGPKKPVRRELYLPLKPVLGLKTGNMIAEYLSMIEGIKGTMSYFGTREIPYSTVSLKLFTDNDSLRLLINEGSTARSYRIIPYHVQAKKMLSVFGKYKAFRLDRSFFVQMFGH